MLGEAHGHEGSSTSAPPACEECRREASGSYEEDEEVHEGERSGASLRGLRQGPDLARQQRAPKGPSCFRHGEAHNSAMANRLGRRPTFVIPGIGQARLGGVVSFPPMVRINKARWVSGGLESTLGRRTAGF
jgi:hypothetical protein